MTVVVHSFVADNSLLVLDLWFGGFFLVSAVCLPDYGSHFSFATSICVLVFLLCHRHLWSVLFFFATGICVQSLSFTAFSAVGIHVRLFVFALLVLVSGYQYISQFLVSCYVLAAHQLHPWRFKPELFPSWLPCGQPCKFRFEANPIWYSAIKFTKSHSAKCSLHKWAWLRHSSQIVWIAQIWPIFASQQVDSAGTHA